MPRSVSPSDDTTKHRESTAKAVLMSLDSVMPTVGGQHQQTIDADGGGELDREDPEPKNTPERLGRYQLRRMLGRGGFGTVFLAYDEKLHREVAIKVPHRRGSAAGRWVKKYLAEARVLAQLEHPGIVAIHDIVTEGYELPCIVSAFVDGTTLQQRMHHDPPTLSQAIAILRDVLAALGFMHERSFVHRDIKPGNILLDHRSHAVLADFGLALQTFDADSQEGPIGTPAYMSPEMARGETHLIDGRSDLFSVGVILYEMLTGTSPFAAKNFAGTLDRVIRRTPKPPREIQPTIPHHLERICLRAIAKPRSLRYGTAEEFSDELAFVLEEMGTHSHTVVAPEQVWTEAETPLALGRQPVVPRGLQAYGKHDASFFRQLLPGPHDRHWVPESLRFWQRRIETDDSSDRFRVGVLYGPSGCGKSSLVRAGLIPLLSRQTEVIFVEANHRNTEQRLARRLSQHTDRIEAANVAEGFAAVRRRFEEGTSSPSSKHLLVVIDQFEQWLHGRDLTESAELVEALRQCDGRHLQTLLLVRDDFWLPLTRLMDRIEEPIRQHHNAALMDLFTAEHARQVMVDLGIGYGRLPSDRAAIGPDQHRFLDEAIELLSDRGKVFPVQLALLVEMLRGQTWEPATLEHLGGIDGIGTRFLDDSFVGPHAPAQQRIHQAAARKVLRSLLPDHDVDIKGSMQRETQLLEVSGYTDQPDRFEQLVEILDNQLRLITPTDPAGVTDPNDSIGPDTKPEPHYQLTHDFMVPAIRRWLNLHQIETARGRAEMSLEDHTSLWRTKPATRLLPSWPTWIRIRMLTRSSDWSPDEGSMMRSADRVHVVRSAAALLIIGVAVWGWNRIQHRAQVQTLVSQVASAGPDELPGLVEQTQVVLSGTSPSKYLMSQFAPADHWRLHLARPHGSPGRQEALLDNLDNVSWSEAAVMAKCFGPSTPVIRDRLIDEIGGADSEEYLTHSVDGDRSEDDGPNGPAERAVLRRLMILASDGFAGEAAASLVQNDATRFAKALLGLAQRSPVDAQTAARSLLSLGDPIAAAMAGEITTHDRTPQSMLATGLIDDLIGHQPERLLDHYLDLPIRTHQRLFDRLAGAEKTLEQKLSLAAIDIATDAPTARRRGLACGLLFSFGRSESLWPTLAAVGPSEARCYARYQIGVGGGDLEVLLHRFASDSRPLARQTLLQICGQPIFSQQRHALGDRVRDIARDAFANDPDAGVHASAYWLLCQIGDDDWASAQIQRWSGEAYRWDDHPRSRRWFVNAEGQTFSVIDARHVPDIGRVYAIGWEEVSVADFLEFDPDAEHYEERSPEPDCPIGRVRWFDAAAYCDWVSKRGGHGNGEARYDADPTRGPNEVADQRQLLHPRFRLPTAWEWTHAAFGEDDPLRRFGRDLELINDYGMFYDESERRFGGVRYLPGRERLPTEAGVFGMFASVREWCHDGDRLRRFIAGSATNSTAEFIFTKTQAERTALAKDLPRSVNGYYGFRMAMTIASP